jgi:hypothetical protein
VQGAKKNAEPAGHGGPINPLGKGSKMKSIATRLSAWFLVCALGAYGALASAQTALIPLNQLVGGGSITAGDLTFSNFTIPNPPPGSVTVPFSVPIPMPEFGDIAVSATANANGTVSLAFVAIDPATGAPSPLVVSPDAGAQCP